MIVFMSMEISGLPALKYALGNKEWDYAELQFMGAKDCKSVPKLLAKKYKSVTIHADSSLYGFDVLLPDGSEDILPFKSGYDVLGLLKLHALLISKGIDHRLFDNLERQIYPYIERIR